METAIQETVSVCSAPKCEVLSVLGEMGLRLSQSRNSEASLQGIAPLVDRLAGVETWGLFLANKSDSFRLTIGHGGWRCVTWALDIPAGVLESFVPDRRSDGAHSGTDSPVPDYESIRYLLEKKPENVIGVAIWSGRRLAGVLVTVVFSTTEVSKSLVRHQALEVLAETIGLAMGRDTSARVWRARAFHDPLTGVLNRRGFDYWYDRWTLLARKGDLSFCLVLIDLDHFKEVNDRHGHPAGDRLLTTIAHVLQEQKRSVDKVARLGGDEFALLLSNVTLTTALSIVSRLKVKVKAFPLTVKDSGISIVGSFSFGIGQSSGSQTEPILLFSKADEDLYRQKKRDKSTC